jgi:hypothetical protein
MDANLRDATTKLAPWRSKAPGVGLSDEVGNFECDLRVRGWLSWAREDHCDDCDRDGSAGGGA